MERPKKKKKKERNWKGWREDSEGRMSVGRVEVE